MAIGVRFYSRSGNTQKLAEAIAKAVNTSAQPISQKIEGTVDLLFLGGAIYAGKVDKSMKEYIEKLDPDQIKKVAVFTTSSSKNPAYEKYKILIEKQNIPVAEKSFHCQGKFLFSNKGRPNEEDCAEAVKFAKSLL